MRLPLAILTFILLIQTSCQLESERTQIPKLTGPAFAAQKQIDAVGLAIDAYRFEDALDQARQLRPWVEAHTDSLPDTLRARLYQYLAELHSKQWESFDSISYYTAVAQQLLPDDVPTLLWARQLYVKAYGRTAYDRTWTDIMLTADLGIKLLEEHRLTAHPLYPKLLVTRGIGGKKYADGLNDPAEKRREYLHCANLVRDAIDRFHTIDSAWERDAWVELAFLEMRMNNPSPELQSILDTIGKLDFLQKSIDSLYVNSYYHFYGNRLAQAYTCAAELVTHGPSISYKLLSGGSYVAEEAARLQREYDLALGHLSTTTRRFGCCLTEAWDDGEADCKNPRGCANYAIGYANIMLERSQAENSVKLLDSAFALSQWAMRQYELNFRNEQEESALNVMQVLGQRMLNTSLEAAYQITVRDASANTLFQTMERGKALLLQLDLQEGLADATNAHIANDFRNLRAQTEELKNRYVREGQLPLVDLVRYQRVAREFERLSSNYAPANSNVPLTRFANRNSALPTLEQVQSTLMDTQALLELVETDSSVIGLYVDRDTVVSYRIEAARLNTLSRGFMSALKASAQRSADTSNYYRLANDLFTLLLGPVTDGLAHRGELLVAASPLLNDVPLAALMDDPDHYLLDRLMIRYIPSWRVELQHAARREELSQNSAKPEQVATWTHPNLSNYFAPLNDYLAAHGNYHPLPPTSDLSAATDADILHLSVHARGNPARLHDNYLYFSPTDSMNGIMIGRQSLDARLVVLAACSTARGYATPGEGTFSLQRSFHIAGVPDVVSSVYDIPATVTSVLLIEFYEQLFAGASPATALHLAKTKMRAGYLNGRYSAPGFWAGCVIG